jgi:anaerobic ribonucleoside-triphosphate reductase activating protein
MRIHKLLAPSEVNGPGRRAVVWLQGCDLGCPGCWNPKSHSREAGTEMALYEVSRWVFEQHEREAITGVTFSGGEPCQQIKELQSLVVTLRCTMGDKFSLGLFSGYTLEELENGRYAAPNFRPRLALDENLSNVLAYMWRSTAKYLDWGVFGRYDATRRTQDPVVSSSNQELRLFTNLHRREDFALQGMEARIDSEGLVTLTGFPDARFKNTLRDLGLEIENVTTS